MSVNSICNQHKSFHNVGLVIAILIITQLWLVGCSDTAEPELDDRVIALVNGTLIDGTGSDPQPNVTVLIEDDIIIQVGDTSDIQIPSSAIVLDMEGRTILPGFINAHVHTFFDEEDLRAFAQGGVTTVRDIGYKKPNLYESLFNTRNTLNENKENARIVAAGPLVTTVGGYGGLAVSSAEDAANNVARLIDFGADLIKIAIENNLGGGVWPMLSQAEIDTIVSTAHNRGKRVTAHISRSFHLRMAIDGNVDDLAHMIVDDLSEDLLLEIIEKDMYWIPTLELWSRVSADNSFIWDEIAIQNLRLFILEGGKVAIGTDFGALLTKFDLGMPMTEIKLMRQAGMTRMQIIVAGTKNGAHVCGLADKLGTIEENKIADIIVVDGNPLQNLNALSDVKVVIHDGVIIRNTL